MDCSCSYQNDISSLIYMSSYQVMTPSIIMQFKVNLIQVACKVPPALCNITFSDNKP